MKVTGDPPSTPEQSSSDQIPDLSGVSLEAILYDDSGSSEEIVQGIHIEATVVNVTIETPIRISFENIIEEFRDQSEHRNRGWGLSQCHVRSDEEDEFCKTRRGNQGRHHRRDRGWGSAGLLASRGHEKLEKRNGQLGRALGAARRPYA